MQNKTFLTAQWPVA